VRSRVLVIDVTATGDADNAAAAGNELVLLPAEIVPGSSVPDPSGRWLALLARAASAPGGRDMLNLCVLELEPGGVFRDLADLGSGERAPSTAPIAWSAGTMARPAQLVFVAPAPASASTDPIDLFRVFGALRLAPPPSGLFIADLDGLWPMAAQPRRLGTTLNTLGPVWRSEHSLLGFGRRDEGTLALRSIDPTSGAAHDLNVQVPASTGRGAGPAARWDVGHGQVLLLARPSNGALAGKSAPGGPLQAWLVSFAAPRTTTGASH
jgi:hypothetical protein